MIRMSDFNDANLIHTDTADAISPMMYFFISFLVHIPQLFFQSNDVHEIYISWREKTSGEWMNRVAC